MVRMLESLGHWVGATDLITGTDFFNNNYSWEYDVQVTNPPFSMKYAWLERSYALGHPFALLLPLETAGAARAQRLFEKYGIEIVCMASRINFKMPSHRTWEETLKPTILTDEDGNIVYVTNKKGERVPKKTSGAQFPVAWFTHGLGIGRGVTWNVHVDRVLQPWERASK